MRTVLVASRDSNFCGRAMFALEAAGFEVVVAYSSYSAEYALEAHDVDVAVIDAEIPAEDPPERSKALVEDFPDVRFVITKAWLLNRELFELFAARKAVFLDTPDSRALVEAVRRGWDLPRSTPEQRPASASTCGGADSHEHP